MTTSQAVSRSTERCQKIIESSNYVYYGTSHKSDDADHLLGSPHINVHTVPWNNLKCSNSKIIACFHFTLLLEVKTDSQCKFSCLSFLHVSGNSCYHIIFRRWPVNNTCFPWLFGRWYVTLTFMKTFTFFKRPWFCASGDYDHTIYTMIT